MAQRSPSDCNRQPWRVHAYTSADDKRRVLRVQNGNLGFGHLAARILLICADVRAYVTSGERHEAYINCGMFAMTLIYALQAQGIVSCCLNLSRYSFQEAAVRRACRIAAWELPAMMIAIGYPPAEFKVAVSARLPVEDVLSWRTF
jgi:nitroreductase